MKEVTYDDWVKNPTPRMMWVWDIKESDKVQRKVIYFFNSKTTLPIVTVTNHDISTQYFMHCAEIKEPRLMTNKELARWLREKPTREFKYSSSISSSVYSTYTYAEDNGDEEVRKDIVIRENDGEWKEPLVEESE